MASVKALTKKPRKKVVRGAPRIKRGNKLSEPSWEGCLDWSGETFHKFKRESGAWYYEHFKAADLYPAVFEWMKENGYSKTDIAAAKAAPTHALSVTAGIQAKMLMNGMPDTNPKHDAYWKSMPGCMGDKVSPVTEFLVTRITLAIEQGSKIVEEMKDTGLGDWLLK